MPESDLSAGELMVAQGAQVIRIENDQMASIALARPRDEAQVKERALAQLDADADAAAAAYYSIPYKDHHRNRGGQTGCTGLSDDSCPVKEEVEGIGIDGARELARLWRNNTTRVYFADEDDDWVRLSAIYLDLETNVRVEVPYGVSKSAVARDGSVYTLNPSRLAMAIQAGVSKAARNAIVQGLPRHLSRAYYHRAKEILGQGDAIDVPRLVDAFGAYDVTREQLEGFFGEPLEGLDAAKRRSLRGLYAAIRDGHVDPARHFQSAAEGAAPPDSGPGGEAASPAAGAKATVTGGAEASASQEARGAVEPDTTVEAPPLERQDEPAPEPTPDPVQSGPAEPTTAPRDDAEQQALDDFFDA